MGIELAPFVGIPDAIWYGEIRDCPRGGGFSEWR